MYKLLSAFLARLFKPLLREFDRVVREIEVNRVLIAKELLMDLNAKDIHSLRDVEFKVFSQWGEDGIIQYLISRVPVSNEVFIEFGVENYQESNTRFLLVNNNWRGLVLDGSENNIRHIQESPFYWRHNLDARCAFITAENINKLIDESGILGDIGLLSIDVDGNDYWIWKAISKDVIDPRIVVLEYNSLFGSERAVVVPYDPGFSRSKAHYSNLYYGASLKALCQLAEEKGYGFVGSNSAGNNAFFVRLDVAANLSVLECAQGYVQSKFRESRDENGRLTYLTRARQLDMIRHSPVVDLDYGGTKPISELIVNA